MAAEVIAGRYVLCDPIGTGGSGTVWRSFDRILNRYCAAKLLRQRDAGELLRFAREQSVRLHHPNIVSPYAWAADDGMVLIVSELIDGGSLQVLLGDYGALAEETVVEILDQVLSALEAVHSAELIHRDVKPGNLLLRATGTGPLQVMLADFGLTISQRDARLTEVGMVIGTPGYLPPEVLVGGVSPEPAHDMYAVGRLALTLLAGHEVPTADQGDIPIIDPILRDVVRGMLFADPAKRPENALAARTMLQDAGRSAGPLTRDGDMITVLDQLPPLPDGWGGAGEIQRSSAQQGPAKGVGSTLVESAGPVALDAPTGRLLDVAAATAPMVSAGSAGAGAGSAGVGSAGAGSAGAGSAIAMAPVAGGPPSRRRRPWSRRAVAVAAVAGLLLVSAAIVGVIFVQSNHTGPGTVIGTPNSSVSTTSAAGSAAATTDSALRVGDACGWQVEGDRRSTADGELVCAVDGGTYRWVSAPG